MVHEIHAALPKNRLACRFLKRFEVELTVIKATSWAGTMLDLERMRRGAMPDEPKTEKRTFTEEIELTGSQLVERVNALLAEGKVRQLRIKAQDGDIYLETPLTIGVIAGGAVVLAAPWLAILGALAALVTRLKIEVVREGEEETPAAVDESKAA
jgi:hypothetical protein